MAAQIDRFAAVLRADADRFGVGKISGSGQHAARAGSHQHSSKGAAREAQGPGQEQGNPEPANTGGTALPEGD